MICVGTRVCHWSQGRLCCSTPWLWLWQSIFMHHLSSAVATGLFKKKTWLSDTPKRIYCKSGPCTYHQPLDITFLIPMATRDRWKFIFSLPHRRKILIAAIIGWDKASICFKIAAIDFDPEVLMDSCRSVGFKCYAANLLPQTAAAKGGIQRSAQILELQMALFHFVGNKITEIPLWHRYFCCHQNIRIINFPCLF